MADTIKINGLKELKTALKISAEKIPVAMARAINETLTPTIKEASKEIRKEYNILASEAKDAFKKPWRATKYNLEGKITATGVPLGFMRPDGKFRFGGSQRKWGVSFKIKQKGEGRGGGGRKYFETLVVGKGGKRAYTFQNGKFKALYSSRVTDVLENEDRMKPILEFADEKMSERLDKAIKDILRGY